MDSQDKRLAAIGAQLDGEAAVARELGEKVEVSEMELIALVSMAYYGAISVLIEVGVDDILEAKELKAELDIAIESKFRQPGRMGKSKLVQLIIGMVTQDRLGQYSVTNH